METVGFFTGLKLMWTALVSAIVQLCQAGEITCKGVKGVAESFEESTQVLKANVSAWAKEDEQLKLLKAPQ